MQTFEIKIVGVAPMLMHNVRLVDKSNEWTKAIDDINSKRKKTDDDLAERSRLEWYGSMYADVGNHPIIPSDMLWACITDGAKQTRDGKTAAAGILEITDATLEYDGPKTVDPLWKDGRFVDKRIVVIQRQRVMRTRPKFMQWAATFNLTADTETTIKNAAMLQTWIENAGRYKGIGDYRPRFGRFNLESFKEVAS